jgi:hypothetical protein
MSTFSKKHENEPNNVLRLDGVQCRAIGTASFVPTPTLRMKLLHYSVLGAECFLWGLLMLGVWYVIVSPSSNVPATTRLPLQMGSEPTARKS